MQNGPISTSGRGSRLALRNSPPTASGESNPSPKPSRRLRREQDVQVIFFQNGWDPELRRRRRPRFTNWHKGPNALKTMRKNPELMGTLLPRRPGIYALSMNSGASPGTLRICFLNRVTADSINTAFDQPVICASRKASVHPGLTGHCHLNVCVESTCATAFFPEILYGCGSWRGRDSPAGRFSMCSRPLLTQHLKPFSGWVR